jgi:hypothetical protein
MATVVHAVSTSWSTSNRYVAWLSENPGRRAGFTYLFLLGLSPFSLVYVPGRLIVTGNAAATARNILGAESLFRASICVTLATAIGFIFVARTLSRFVGDVDRSKAALMETLVYVSVAISFALALNDLAVITVLRGGEVLAPFSAAQREALAYLFLRLRSQGLLLSMVFWGLWLVPFGWLVVRSKFIPRVLGVLLIVNGLAYVTQAFVGVQFPGLAPTVAKVVFPALLGEAWIILWLIIAGARPRDSQTA